MFYSFKKKIMLVRGTDYLKDENSNLKGIDFLIDDYIPFVGLSAIVGKPDIGKSLLSKQIAIALANGDEYIFGRKLRSIKRKVLYVSTEDNEYNCGVLFKKQNQNGNSGNIDFCFDSDINHILTIISSDIYDVIFLDAFSDMMPQINNSQLRRDLDAIHNACMDLKCCIIMVNHITKYGYNKKPNQSYVQGLTSFTQKVRSILQLSSGFSDYRYLNCIKGNYVTRQSKDLYTCLKLNTDRLMFSLVDTNLKFEFDICNSYHILRNNLKSNFTIKEAKQLLINILMVESPYATGLINLLLFNKLMIQVSNDNYSLVNYEEYIHDLPEYNSGVTRELSYKELRAYNTINRIYRMPILDKENFNFMEKEFVNNNNK